MVGIIELFVWAGGMLEVLELEGMLAGVLQYCLRHWEWSDALPQEALPRVARPRIHMESPRPMGMPVVSMFVWIHGLATQRINCGAEVC